MVDIGLNRKREGPNKCVVDVKVVTRQARNTTQPKEQKVINAKEKVSLLQCIIQKVSTKSLKQVSSTRHTS